MSTHAAGEGQKPQASLRVDTLADTMLILLGLTAVQRLVGFARSVLLCRWLDPEQLGQWDLAFGFLMLAGPTAVLGLPGSFRRYVEYYRQRGQLRPFLRHTTLMTAGLVLLAVVLIGTFSPSFSEFIFGRDDCAHLARLLAAGLAMVVCFNVTCELFSSLRLFRVLSMMQFAQSLLFALLAAALVLVWRRSAESVVIAYSGACLLCGAAALVWLRQTWRSLPAATSALSQRTLLVKLMPFAIWVWTTDWLTHVFDLVARYMLVHHSGLDATAALAAVGNYHSARVVPLLLVTVAGLLGSAAMPHLSHEWESGNRQAVSHQVNLMFKLVLFALLAGGTAILVAEPLLFDVAFGGKYAGGQAVLRHTLMACVWFGVIGIANNYLWCAERAMLSSLALIVGLTANVTLNLVLLPRYGLAGAVIATAAGNLVALATAYSLAVRCGLKFDRGVWILLAIPPVFCAGPWIALATLLTAALWAIAGHQVFSAEEKQQVLAGLKKYRARLPGPWGAKTQAGRAAVGRG